MDFIADIGERLQELLEVTLFKVQGVTITVANVGAFVLALVLSLLLGRVANRALTRALRRGPARANEGTAYALGRVLQYVVTVVGVLVGLENIGISMTMLAAVGAMLAVGLGFGLQNIAQNFVSGLILLLEQPIKKGDVVIVGGVYGVVDEISIRATRVMTFDDVALIVPNSKFISDVVENRSEPSTTFRIRIPVGVAYGTDTLLVHQTLLQVAKDDADVLKEPEPSCFFRNFGDSSLEFELCCWIDDPLGAAQVGSVLRHKIVKAFRRSQDHDSLSAARRAPVPALSPGGLLRRRAVISGEPRPMRLAHCLPILLFACSSATSPRGAAEPGERSEPVETAEATSDDAPAESSEADEASAPPVATVEPEPEPAAPPPPLPEGTVVLHVGSSTAGALGLDLKKELEARNIKCHLRARQSTYIPEWAGEKMGLRQMIRQYDPDLVIVSLGGNEVEITDPTRRIKPIKRLVEAIGDRPCVWVGTPRWEKLRHTGLMEVIRDNSAPCRFVDSDLLVPNLETLKDGVHPTMPERKRWAKRMIEWLEHNRDPAGDKPWSLVEDSVLPPPESPPEPAP